jgi:hypothetical protein
VTPNAFSAVVVRSPSDAAAVPTALPPVGHHPAPIFVKPQGMAGFYNFIMSNPFNPEGTFDDEKEVHIQLHVTAGPDHGAAACAMTILKV